MRGGAAGTGCRRARPARAAGGGSATGGWRPAATARGRMGGSRGRAGGRRRRRGCSAARWHIRRADSLAGAQAHGRACALAHGRLGQRVGMADARANAQEALRRDQPARRCWCALSQHARAPARPPARLFVRKCVCHPAAARLRVRRLLRLMRRPPHAPQPLSAPHAPQPPVRPTRAAAPVRPPCTAAASARPPPPARAGRRTRRSPCPPPRTDEGRQKGAVRRGEADRARRAGNEARGC